MYSRNQHRQAKTGKVGIRNSNERLQLVFTYGGKRHFVSLGLSNSPVNQVLAQEKAFQIQRDIEYGEFDPTYEKYRVQPVLKIVEATPDPLDSTPELGALWAKYIEVRKPGKSPSTIRMYDWIADHIDRCPHQSPSNAQAVFDWFVGHVPADSAKRLIMQLSACCKWAKKSALLDSNPFAGMASEIKVKKSSNEEEEINPFTRQERDRIIATFKTNRYYKRYAPFIEFLFFTGCRPSEAIALQWKHITSSTVLFEQAVVDGGREGLILKKGLKTQDKRKFPVNAQLSALLEKLRPETYNPEALVFPSPKSKFIDWHNFTNRAWSAILESLPDIEYRNPYQTRHTFCSLCREQDIASIQLAKWVGNSAAMIDRVYAKPTDQIQVPTL
jgi:integrase